jgi:uncharacterized protein YndB with AHSA1/START domain
VVDGQAMADTDSTELAFEYPALPDRVWDALTNSAKMSTWLTDNDFVPVLGHRFMLGSNGFPGLPGPVIGEVIEVDPPRRLVMRWRSGSSRAHVTWLVEPVSGGSRLRVIQSGVLGHPMRAAELERVYQVVFGEQLRLLLRTGMLTKLKTDPPSRRPPPPTSNPGTGVAPLSPASGFLPFGPASGVAPSSAAPPKSSAPPTSAVPKSAVPPKSAIPQKSAVPPKSPAVWLLPDAPPPPRPSGAPLDLPEPPPSTGPAALYPRGTPPGTGNTSGETPVVFPIVGLPPTPTKRRPARRALDGQPTNARRALVGWPLGVLVVVVLILAAWGLSIRPAPDSGTDQAGPDGPGSQPAGSAATPTPGGTGRVGPPAGTGPTPSTVVGLPGTTATAGAPTGVPPVAPMTVAYRTTSQGLLTYTVAVSVHNPAGTPQTWHNASLRMSGVSLSVTPADSWVTYRARSPEQCFTPSAAKATVAAGQTVTFSVTVSSVLGGVLGEVDSATLDVPACS